MLESFIHKIHEAALEPACWQPLVDELSEVLQNAAVYLAQTSREVCGRGDIWCSGIDSTIWKSIPVPAQNAERSKLLEQFLTLPQGDLVESSRLLSGVRHDTDPVASAFVHATGLVHFAAARVQADEQSYSCFAVGRPLQHPFSNPELAALRYLLPHLATAMETHRRLSLVDTYSQGLKSALEQIDRGVILADRHLKIHFANRAAERMFSSAGHIVSVKGRLCARKPEDQRSIQLAATRASVGIPAQQLSRIVIGESATGEGCELSVAPAIGAGHGSACPAANIIVCIRPVRRMPKALPMNLLVKEFGLTPTEARVAQLAGTASQLPAIADSLGITRNTAKTHLKAIYAKLGVHSQVELVRHLMPLAY